MTTARRLPSLPPATGSGGPGRSAARSRCGSGRAAGWGLIGEGLSNAEIAARLVVSHATARTHVSRAMTKLGARDRAQLVVIAYQSGLVR